MHERIAEIGTSHVGSIHNAKHLIDEAKKAGANTVKFQWVFADEITSSLSGTISLPTGLIDIYNYFKSIEVPFDFYMQLQEYCYQKKIQFLCSVFGLKSLENLHTLHAQGPFKDQALRIKIASPEINHCVLLHAIQKICTQTNSEVIISTGLASLIDIYRALQILKNSPKKITLLRCVTQYPASLYSYNLTLLQKYKSLFNCEVGLSDHSIDPSLLPSLALALGSSMTEKHFTLGDSNSNQNSKTSPDDPIALTPSQFSEMSAMLQKVEKIYQKKGSAKTLAFVKETFSAKKIEDVLQPTTLAPCATEYPHYETSTRSVSASANIAEGEVFTLHNICLVRCETNLSPGIHAHMYEIILGKKSNRTLRQGEMITYNTIKINS